MDHSLNQTDDDLISRLGNGLTRWVLGPGFLTFHATIFTIAMIGMVLWNFYDSPNEIWVDEVFRRWGAVLAFHAIAVAAGLTAWRLIRAEQQALQADEVQWQPPVQPAAPALPAQSLPTAWSQHVIPDAPATPSTSRRMLTAYQSADAAFGRALADLATWSVDAADRAMRALSAYAVNTYERVRRTPAAANPDPMQTWPASPVNHRPEEEEFISRFAGGNGQTPAGSNEQGVDVVLDVTGYASDTDRRSGPAPVIKDPSQTWVQAATYSWSVSHPIDQADGAPASQNGHAEPHPGMTSTPDN